MESKAPDTLERIQQAALDEFSEKGFLGASLRQIVKHAGVTTGAFYGYFSSKEALFASIVEPHAAILMRISPFPSFPQRNNRSIWAWNQELTFIGWWNMSAGTGNR